MRTLMILTQSWAYEVALTPPNPPPPKEEQKKHTDTMPLSVYWMAKIWKVCNTFHCSEISLLTSGIFFVH